MLETISSQAEKTVTELFEKVNPERGEIFVVGCSSSEVSGHNIGSHSSVEIAESILEGIKPVVEKQGVYLAAQCCEHLNRCIILEHEAAVKYNLEQVNAVPQPKAGGSFATAVYKFLDQPVAVETVRASLGIDIGGTLIGMHLKSVAVPVKLSLDKVGQAHIICARTRLKYIGGERTVYDKSL